MSIPDDPFTANVNPNNPRDSPARASPSPPVLTLSPAGGSHEELTAHAGASPPNQAGPSGIKTPRRVNWMADSHIVSMHEIPPEPASPSRTLDEKNIDQVRDALERHRSRDSGRAHAHHPKSRLSMHSEGDDTSNHEDEEEDYDYRLDTGHHQSRHALALAANDPADHPEDVLAHDSGLQDQLPIYIEPGETDGLPALHPVTSRMSAQDSAMDLVRAHTRKGRFGGLLRRRKNPASNEGVIPETEQEKSHSAFAARYGETPHSSAPGGNQSFAMGMAGLGFAGRAVGGAAKKTAQGGTSVLSSLLTLYGNDDNSRGSTPGSSRAPSTMPSSDSDDSEAERPSAHRSGSHTPNFMKAMKKTVSDFGDSNNRPKAARSSAGVFGALMAGTGNITGAATPAASTLAPAAKRPGYHLSRYSAGEINPEKPHKQWRPEHSRNGSAPNSRPTSMYSGVSGHGNHSPTSSDHTRIDEPHGNRPRALTGDTVRSQGSALSALASSGASLSTPTLNLAPAMTDAREKEKKKKSPGLTLGTIGKFPSQALKAPAAAFNNAEKWIMNGAKTPNSPKDKDADGYFSSEKPRILTEDERRRRDWEVEKKRRKRAKEKKKQQEIFIIQHVAAILNRQQFLMKLARALMMFGSPSHRLESQIQATARVLELNAQVVYLPGTMLISFGDDATHTSETKFLKQATGLDLGKLLATHNLYWKVVHDQISVDVASKDLDVLMTTPVYYNLWQSLVIGGMCSAFICVIGFYGSFIDALMSIPLGMLLVGIQTIAARNDLYSNVFEISVAIIISFLAAALASTKYFCYTAIASGGIVLILPGYIVLSGSLELASRNITSGSVRIGYAVIYSLFLGFGLSMGAEIYRRITSLEIIGDNDYQCSAVHNSTHWYMVRPSEWWYFLCAPGYSLGLSLRNQQPIWAKELPAMIIISCAGWCTNHFSARAFVNRSDITSMFGSFVVGLLGNIWGRFNNGTSFVVMVVGVLFQLPSGLSNGGLFAFAKEGSDGSTETYSTGFSVAEQLISVAIGLTVGLFGAAVVTHPFGGSKRRGGGIFSF